MHLRHPTWYSEDTQPDTPLKTHYQDTVHRRQPTGYSIQVTLSGHCAPEAPNLILHSRHIIRTLCTGDTQPDTPFKSHYQDTVHPRHPTWYAIQVTLSGHWAPETPNLTLHSSHIIRHCAPETPNLILHSRHIIRTLCTWDTQPDTPFMSHCQDTVHLRHPTWYSIQDKLSGHCAPETPNLILHSSHIIRTLCTWDTQPDTPFKTHYQDNVHLRHPTWYSIQDNIIRTLYPRHPTWYSIQVTLSGLCPPETPNLILHSRHIIRTLCTWDTRLDTPKTPNLILHSRHITRTLCTGDNQPDTPFKSHYQDTVHHRHPTWYSTQDTSSGHCATETPNLTLHSSHIIRTLCTQDIQPDTPFKSHYQDTGHLRHPTWHSIQVTLSDTVHPRHPTWYSIQDTLSGCCAPETPNLILHSCHIVRTLCTWDTQPDTPFKTNYQDTVHRRHPTLYSIQVTLSGHCAPETPNLILHSRHIIRMLCTRDTQPDTPFKSHYQDTVHMRIQPDTPFKTHYQDNVHLRHPTWYSIQDTLSGHCTRDIQPDTPFKSHYQDTSCAPETPNLILHSSHIIRTLGHQPKIYLPREFEGQAIE